MALAPGAKLGPYEILAPLGSIGEQQTRGLITIVMSSSLK